MAQTKQQKELIVLGALALASVGLFCLRSRTPRTSSVSGGMVSYTPIRTPESGDLVPSTSPDTKYLSSGRNIFAMVQVGRKATSRYKDERGPANIGPTEALPELPMTFFGYGAASPDGPRKAFLQSADREEILLASEGEVLFRHIRILRIGNDQIDFEDTNTGLKGSKRLELVPAI
jgi:hypothetical protein